MTFLSGLTVSRTVRQIGLLRLGSASLDLGVEGIPDLDYAPSAVLLLGEHRQMEAVLHAGIAGVARAEDRVAEVNPIEIRGRGLIPPRDLGGVVTLGRHHQAGRRIPEVQPVVRRSEPQSGVVAQRVVELGNPRQRREGLGLQDRARDV